MRYPRRNLRTQITCATKGTRRVRIDDINAGRSWQRARTISVWPLRFQKLSFRMRSAGRGGLGRGGVAALGGESEHGAAVRRGRDGGADLVTGLAAQRP